jgi:hypothetical protein
MNIKKDLENHIRGWLPRERNLPSQQEAPTKRAIVGYRRKLAVGLITFGAGFTGAFLAALGVFPNIYVRIGPFWTMVTLVAVYVTAFLGGLIINRKRRKEGQKETKCEKLKDAAEKSYPRLASSRAYTANLAKKKRPQASTYLPMGSNSGCSRHVCGGTSRYFGGVFRSK